jgi:hypothetical protein
MQIAGAKLEFRSSRLYTLMLKQQAQQCNAEAAGAKLQCRSSRLYIVLQKQQAL